MSPFPQAVIRLQGVSKVFPDVPPGTPPALSSLTADVPSGLVVGLVGPDAAGKTTLMRLLAGLLLPTSGPNCAGLKDRRVSPCSKSC